MASPHTTALESAGTDAACRPQSVVLRQLMPSALAHSTSHLAPTRSGDCPHADTHSHSIFPPASAACSPVVFEFALLGCARLLASAEGAAWIGANVLRAAAWLAGCRFCSCCWAAAWSCLLGPDGACALALAFLAAVSACWTCALTSASCWYLRACCAPSCISSSILFCRSAVCPAFSCSGIHGPQHSKLISSHAKPQQHMPCAVMFTDSRSGANRYQFAPPPWAPSPRAKEASHLSTTCLGCWSSQALRLKPGLFSAMSGCSFNHALRLKFLCWSSQSERLKGLSVSLAI
mmetsp:Transcript_9475/g.22417  ORF Transcript_9475/g.22417 Transcript_9475/m.22417 type:complete len:291 (+) Transcript_9475:108-980(+)